MLRRERRGNLVEAFSPRRKNTCSHFRKRKREREKREREKERKRKREREKKRKRERGKKRKREREPPQSSSAHSVVVRSKMPATFAFLSPAILSNACLGVRTHSQWVKMKSESRSERTADKKSKKGKGKRGEGNLSTRAHSVKHDNFVL
jgi:hypothetical protein